MTESYTAIVYSYETGNEVRRESVEVSMKYVTDMPKHLPDGICLGAGFRSNAIAAKVLVSETKEMHILAPTTGAELLKFLLDTLVFRELLHWINVSFSTEKWRSVLVPVFGEPGGPGTRSSPPGPYNWRKTKEAVKAFDPTFPTDKFDAFQWIDDGHTLRLQMRLHGPLRENQTEKAPVVDWEGARLLATRSTD